MAPLASFNTSEKSGLNSDPFRFDGREDRGLLLAKDAPDG
jgi:hypothetical protein